MKRSTVTVLVLGATLVAVPEGTASAAACTQASQRLSRVTVSGAESGGKVTVKVWLNCARKKAVYIGLTGYRGLKVPARVKVPAGKRYVKTTATAPVTASAKKVALKVGFPGPDKTVRFTVAPCRKPVVSSLKVPALQFMKSKDGEVALSCAPRSAFQVKLRSSHPEVSVPATLTVPKGKTSAEFYISSGAEGDQFQAVVTATGGGKSIKAKTTVSPGFIGKRRYGTLAQPEILVMLSGRAPAWPVTRAYVASDDLTLGSVPSAYTTFAPGTTSVRVPVSLATVSKEATVAFVVDVGGPGDGGSTLMWTIPAAYDGSQGFDVAAEDLAAGAEDTFRVVLKAPALPGLTAQIAVRDDDPALVVAEPQMTFGKHEYEKTFKVKAADVTQPTKVTLDVTVLGTTVSKTLVIRPPATENP